MNRKAEGGVLLLPFAFCILPSELFDPVLVELLPQRVPMQAEFLRGRSALAKLVRQRGVQEWRFNEAQEAFVEVFSFAVFPQSSISPLLNELRETRGW